MPIKDRSSLYEEFQNGDIPDQNDFADTIDSALNLVDDGLVSYKTLTPTGVVKRFGFGGETTPQAPIGIKGETGQDDQMISFRSSDDSQMWNINLNPTGNDVDGFSIDDATSGIGTSRFFIDQVSQGNIGIGTVEPEQKVHVAGAHDGGDISIMVENMESGTETGWLMSAINDNAVVERNNTFAIQEKNASELTERITVLGAHGLPGNPIYNVGINEVLPYATLHVTKPAADPTEPVNLAENTGIVCVGQIDDRNLVFDSSQIQARTGEYISGPTLSFTATELSLQPYGGTININKATGDPTDLVSIDSDGKLGVGKKANEKLEVNGAVVVGDTNTATPSDGTIRWHNADKDLQVWQNSKWNSLTTHTNTDGLWTDGGGGLIYYDTASGHPKVGIGVAQSQATLHVKTVNNSASATTVTGLIANQAATAIADAALSRVGLAINCTGLWNTNAAALNIGLYISNVSGQTAAESNIAALCNGNTVIGNITGNSLVGSGGTNVLAIQNGAAPTSTPGITETTGVQIYSDNVTSIAGTPISALHLMTGDGAIMTLYRQADMTPSDINVPNTGNAVTDAVIENMRTRINELEAILKKLGLLTP